VAVAVVRLPSDVDRQNNKPPSSMKKRTLAQHGKAAACHRQARGYAPSMRHPRGAHRGFTPHSLALRHSSAGGVPSPPPSSPRHSPTHARPMQSPAHILTKSDLHLYKTTPRPSIRIYVHAAMEEPSTHGPLQRQRSFPFTPSLGLGLNTGAGGL